MIPNLRSHLQHGKPIMPPFFGAFYPLFRTHFVSITLIFCIVVVHLFFFFHPHHCPATWVSSPIKCPSAQEGPSTGAQRGPLLKFFFIYILLFFLAFIVNFSQIFSRHPRHICTQITPHRDISQSSPHFKCALLHEKTACLLGSLKDLTSEAFSFSKKNPA